MIHLVLGTKAQFIKMAPIMVELERRRVPYNFLFTGQHQQHIDEMLAGFALRLPDHVLRVGGDLTRVRSLMGWFARHSLSLLGKCREYFQRDRGGIVLVHGDTASTLLGALMGRAAGLVVAHVEAGLRSARALQPFPEELIRRMVFRLSRVLFCPGAWAVDNVRHLQKETVNTGHNTLLDALRLVSGNGQPTDHVPQHPFGLVSIHRYENVFRPATFARILRLIENAAERVPLLFIMHPVTERRLMESGWLERLEGNPRIQLRRRYPYSAFMALLRQAEFLITDGGSNQEESFYLGIPCLLMRQVTERTEGLGANVVLSGCQEAVVTRFIANYPNHRLPPSRPSCSPTHIIVDTILTYAS